MSTFARTQKWDDAARPEPERPVNVLGKGADAPQLEQSHLQVGLAWLLRLRWGAVGGQSIALLFAALVLGFELPYTFLVTLIVLTASSNAALTLWRGAATREGTLPVVLTFDVMVLTAMLANSGGASNPFVAFYIVHVALAALLLKPRLAWSVVSSTMLMFAALFVLPSTTPLLQMAPHLFGTWIAYVLSAAFVAYFVGQVSLALRERGQRAAELSRLTAQNERLASLSSFSANAAHELGTPLSTIALASRELAIGLERGSEATSLVDDADLIRKEAGRCRDILASLSARAGESMGEMPLSTTPEAVVACVLRELPRSYAERLRVTYEGDSRSPFVAPRDTLARMLQNLIRNAYEAQEEAGVDQPVELRVECSRELCFHVLDRGAGPEAAIRARLGEPFVTTKGARGGLGLGLYLARAYAERSDGHLAFSPRAGGGSDFELRLARHLHATNG
jgi:two-component system, sensor histidine kinase RegB